jgi:hypothetical protein
MSPHHLRAWTATMKAVPPTSRISDTDGTRTVPRMEKRYGWGEGRNLWKMA